MQIKLKPELSYYSEKKETKVNTFTDTLPEELKDLGYDLTAKIANSNMTKIVGRDDEILRTIEILCRKTKNKEV